jgi:hypothetical protein
LYLWLVPKILLRFWWGVCIFGGFRNLILVFGGFLEPDCISGGLSFTFGGSGMSVAVVATPFPYHCCYCLGSRATNTLAGIMP